jgi:ATP-dependent helicase/nuclease subunit B
MGDIIRFKGAFLVLSLTPNRRLAAFLVQQHNKQQAAAHKKAWETPAIYPLEVWLAQLWDLVLENTQQKPKTILSKNQQQILWEKIIQESSVGVELLRIAATAKNALQAWKFISQWQLELKTLEAFAKFSPDTEVFYTWLQSYLTWLGENDYTDSCLMIDMVTQHIATIVDKLPQEIELISVDDMPPQYLALFAKLAELGVSSSQQQIVKPGAMVSRAVFASVDLELQAAALWAKNCLQQNPDQTIAIVIPELEQTRAKVQRIIHQELASEIVNISAPLNIGSYSLIDSALLILQLAKSIIKYEDLSILLRSPFIASAEAELCSRAVLDRNLREKAEAKLSWRTVSKLLSNHDSKLTVMINNFIENLGKTKGTHNAEYWQQTFQTLLASWGWPGERELSIEESHLLSCWQDLLQDYCQLGAVVADHGYAQALQYLLRLAIDTPFLPAESGLTKIHVLGILEASGIVFDQLWVTGMARDSWPPDAAPNPFIPLELQRAVDIPRSSPQRELKVARRLTETLKQGAKHAVVFSYPQMIDDHLSEPSNLIAELPAVDFVFNSSVLVQGNLILEQINDWQAPALEQHQVIKGGSNILKLQAQCPFKAFAQVRLNAKELKEPELILNATDRGNIIHKVMEDFWQECKTHDALAKCLPEALSAILGKIIDQILHKLRLKRPQTLNDNYIDLEKKRLLALITRWLEYEKSRESFVVESIEQKVIISVGPLTLNLRVDRVDRLDDGSQIIIDYKTGHIAISSWSAERIIEPQLPLYTLAYDRNIVALGIASIRADKLKFSGLAQDVGLLPNVAVAKNWHENLENWRTNLNNTASNFANGQAQVDPCSKQICKNCNLPALCRIYDC